MPLEPYEIPEDMYPWCRDMGMPRTIPPVLHARQMAKYLHLSHTTIGKMLAAGVIPNHTVGQGKKKYRRVNAPDFLEYLSRSVHP